MFPTPTAIECYTSASPEYKSFYERNDIISKLFFVPTCIPDLTPVTKKNSTNIPDLPKDSIVLCYVGRHTEIKGYEYLKEIASSILKRKNNVYFLIGGNAESSHPLEDSRWIELGWVDTISLLAKADAFILPNKQTYFDLITLEVLRSGTPLITTYTGGNKFFGSINNGSIVFIPNNDVDNAVQTILTAINEGLSCKSALSRNMYETFFQMDNYVEKYTTELIRLLNV